MKIDIITIFPDFFRGPLDFGIVRRSREAGLVEIEVHDLRVFAHDRHKTVDDRPFGGGEGMLLKPEPIFECVEKLGVRAARVVQRRQRGNSDAAFGAGKALHSGNCARAFQHESHGADLRPVRRSG